MSKDLCAFPACTLLWCLSIMLIQNSCSSPSSPGDFPFGRCCISASTSSGVIHACSNLCSLQEIFGDILFSEVAISLLWFGLFSGMSEVCIELWCICAISLISFAESEYIVSTHTSKEVIYLWHLTSELSPIINNPKRLSKPTTLFCNNQSAIHFMKDTIFHYKTKYIDMQFYFVCQTVAQGHIVLKFIYTVNMIANVFTKSFAQVTFKKFWSLLGIN